ncbi:hypothetical protein NDU88_006077 [Pleurodeles waltl]|uniref:Uncharacterized protein n=1 Tax=Pleurodeles waltl TaxID=8319 RepID=A0AAV7VQ18_PLEWA|nr:hypothetical protein NDU88_006077 [Pleurodeles waltl]
MEGGEPEVATREADADMETNVVPCGEVEEEEYVPWDVLKKMNCAFPIVRFVYDSLITGCPKEISAFVGLYGWQHNKMASPILKRELLRWDQPTWPTGREPRRLRDRPHIYGPPFSAVWGEPQAIRAPQRCCEAQESVGLTTAPWTSVAGGP